MGLFNIKFEDTGKYDYDTLISLQEAWAIYGPCRLRYSVPNPHNINYILDIIDYNDEYFIYNVDNLNGDNPTKNKEAQLKVTQTSKEKSYKFVSKL